MTEYSFFSPDSGSISNLKEEELSPAKKTPSLSVQSPTAASHPKSGSSTRTTRSRSRATELVQSPPIIVDEATNESPKPSSRASKERESSPTSRPPSSAHASPSPRYIVPKTLPADEVNEETDEDNDELDLISPSTFPVDGERHPSDDATKDHKSPTPVESTEEKDEALVKPQPSSNIGGILTADSMNTETTDQLHSPPPMLLVKLPIQESDPADNANNQSLELSTSNMDMSVDTHDGQMQKPPESEMLAELKGPLENSDGQMQIETRVEIEESIQDISMDLDSEDGEAKAVVSVPAAPPSILARPYVPIHIPLPPSIEEKIVILAPASAPEEVQYNLDVENEAEAPKPISESTIEDGPHFNPQYPLPPLSVLPADFVRKAKPIRRKKEKDSKRDKEKDDTIPMGLARWGATVMTNPVHKRVARATKCLSTREWGVRFCRFIICRLFIDIFEGCNDGIAFDSNHRQNRGT